MENFLFMAFIASLLILAIGCVANVVTNERKYTFYIIGIAYFFLIAELTIFGFINHAEQKERQMLIDKACISLGYEGGTKTNTKQIGTTSQGINVIFCYDKLGVFRAQIPAK